MFTAEDYQSLFTELGGTKAQPSEPQKPVNNQALVDPTPSAEQPAAATVSSENTNTATEVQDNNAASEAQAQDTTQTPADTQANDDNQKQARAFAEMRSTIGKYQKIFKQLAPMMGVKSEDEVIERLLDTGLNVQARTQNVSPELLKRMQTLEEQNIAMLQAQKQQAIVESFGVLQKDFNLTNEEVINFAKELDQKGIDLFKIGIDVSTLYRGLHHDTLTNKAISAAQQQWVVDGAKAKNAPGVTQSTGKRNPETKTAINTMGELETLFNSLDLKK